jgi:hypothetical protein
MIASLSKERQAKQQKTIIAAALSLDELHGFE